MKNSKKLVFGALLVLTQTFAQQVEVPATVKSAFAKKFPTIKKVKWDKENATEWEAAFKMNGEEYSANFNNDGTWMETEQEIKKDAIPATVKKTLDSQFSGFKIEEAEVSETAKGKVYEFELEKGKEKLEVAISPEGKLIKKETKNPNEKDND